MPDILIRNVDAKALQGLKKRAKRNGRSLQSEAKLLLEQAAESDSSVMAAFLDKWERRFAGRKFVSTVELLREDRDR